MSAALPPGPGAGRLAQTVGLHRDPIGALERARAAFGDVFTLRLTAGPLVIVADRAALPSLLEGDPERAHAGAARRTILPQATERSSFGGDGAVHRETRDRVAAAFARAPMDEARPAFATIAARHAGAWPSRPFRLVERMRDLCDEAFATVVLGIDDPGRATALTSAVRRMLNTPGNPPVTPPGPRAGLVGRALAPEVARRLAAVEDALRAALRDEPRPAGPPRVLDLVREAGLDEREAIDELLPLLMAAQEPPAIALTHILDGLVRRGSDAWEDAGALRAFAAETLRLRPPALASLRRLTAPLQAGGFELAAGTDTAVPIPLVHRDPVLHDAPERFVPERFAAGEPPPPGYLAFGSGARRCVGEWLARALIDEVVPAVLRERALRPVLPAQDRLVLRATTLLPQRGALVR